jgi:hypothetical protein
MERDAYNENLVRGKVTGHEMDSRRTDAIKVKDRAAEQLFLSSCAH